MIIKYAMTCSCGDIMPVEAESREAAVEMLKAILNQEAVEAHVNEKHTGAEIPSRAEIQEMIEEGLEMEALLVP